MISKQHRFHGLNSLRFAYRRGTTVRGPLFAVKVAQNPRRDTYRAAVVISRKVNKSAVARNRMRRRLYESLRALEDDIDGPYDIVISVFQSDVLSAPAGSLNSQLRRQLAKAGGLGNPSSARAEAKLLL
jgi:ribonuclease P protein component